MTRERGIPSRRIRYLNIKNTEFLWANSHIHQVTAWSISGYRFKKQFRGEINRGEICGLLAAAAAMLAAQLVNTFAHHLAGVTLQQHEAMSLLLSANETIILWLCFGKALKSTDRLQVHHTAQLLTQVEVDSSRIMPLERLCYIRGDSKH